MISLPVLLVTSAQNARIRLRRFAFAEMKQIASGWGLQSGFPSPEENHQKPLDLGFSDRSRRVLNRKGLQTRNLPSGR